MDFQWISNMFLDCKNFFNIDGLFIKRVPCLQVGQQFGFNV